MFRACTFSLLIALLSPIAATAQDSPDIELSTPQEAELGPGGSLSYEIALDENRFLYGEVLQVSVDVVVRTYAPDGTQLASFDQPARGPEPFTLETKRSGRYRIEVAPYNENERGSYVIEIKRIEPMAASKGSRVDQIMAGYDRNDRPGASIAVSRGGELVFSGSYGMANLEYDVPIEPNTVFHVASVSKQFTAFAIAMLADQGLLSLDDEIQQHLPTLPHFDQPITIRHLVHHTSGLRDQWTLWAMAGGRLDDVITQDGLFRLVERQRELNFEPGSEFLYCNSGYMLLAKIVEEVSGISFRSWMKTNVFEPMEMNHTEIYDDHRRLVDGRAYSYRLAQNGDVEKTVLSYANSGATSLFTTAGDLGKWLHNFTTARVGGRNVIDQVLDRGILNNGDTLGYAFGVTIDEQKGLTRIQHSGGDAGYRSFVAYYPEVETGIVVLSNLAQFSPPIISNLVADVFLEEEFSTQVQEPEQPSETEEGDSNAVDTAILDRYAGDYFLEATGLILEITREAGSLYAQATGQPRVKMMATDDSTFVIDEAQARIVFHLPVEGLVQEATLYQPGPMVLRRVEPYTPSSADLERFAGSHYSPELETVYTLAVENDTLVAKHRRHGNIKLTPIKTDQFNGDIWFFGEIRFERDQSGNLTGMSVSSGRVRNVWFERRN